MKLLIVAFITAILLSIAARSNNQSLVESSEEYFARIQNTVVADDFAVPACKRSTEAAFNYLYNRNQYPVVRKALVCEVLYQAADDCAFSGKNYALPVANSLEANGCIL